MNLRQALLYPASLIYGSIISARNTRFDRRPGAVRRVRAPVISVGNLTAGGTGKTPLVIEIVRLLERHRRRPAILTRGYGAQRGQMADEVQEFQAALPKTPVVVNADRVLGADRAQREFGADVLVLDDGFQHRRLGRDLDLVLIDALQPWGGGQLLPAGLLREPLSSLRRAGGVVITRANQVSSAALQRLRREIAGLCASAPIFVAGVEADRLTDARGKDVPLTSLHGQRVAAVCGLGNPRTFVALLKSAGRAAEVAALRFRDHHRYRDADMKRIENHARHHRCDVVVTTRKDWSKLAPLWPPDAPTPLLRLDVRVVVDDAAGFERLILRVVASA